jgi:hypothetical protein
MGRSAHVRALNRARKERLIPADIPRLFRWLQQPTPGSAGGSGPDDQHSPSGEQPAVQSWGEFKESIHLRLKTGQNRMRQDTKRLAKIESVTKSLVEALELGASLDIAAAYSGIRPVEFREWLALGHSRPRSIYGAFLSLIQAAIAKCDVQDLQVVSKAAAGGEWKASVERLKMRGFGNQTAPDKKPVNVKIVNYNFAAPTQKVLAQTIDYDTLEPVQEEPVRAIENGEESEDSLSERQNTDARGEISTKAGRRHSVLEEPRGETPPENNQEREVDG